MGRPGPGQIRLLVRRRVRHYVRCQGLTSAFVVATERSVERVVLSTRSAYDFWVPRVRFLPNRQPLANALPLRAAFRAPARRTEAFTTADTGPTRAGSQRGTVPRTAARHPLTSNGFRVRVANVWQHRLDGRRG